MPYGWVSEKKAKNIGMMSNRLNPVFFPMLAELHSASESSCLSEIGVECESTRNIVVTNKDARYAHFK